jgi:phage shock protein C
MIAAIFLSSGSILPVYFIAGMVAPDRPRELDATNADEKEFWQSVRRSPARTARDIRLRLKDIDRRLGDVESYVTTENRTLAREIEQLR